MGLMDGLEFKLLPPEQEDFKTLAGLALNPILVLGPFEGVLRSRPRSQEGLLK